MGEVMSDDLDEMIVEMLEAADAYSKAENVALTTLGRFIVNDGGFFENLELSKNCTIKTYRKVMKWFAEKQRAAILPRKSRVQGSKAKRISINPKKSLRASSPINT